MANTSRFRQFPIQGVPLKPWGGSYYGGGKSAAIWESEFFDTTTSSSQPLVIRPQNINLGNPVNKSCPLNRGLVAWWLPLQNNVGGATLYDINNVAGGVNATINNPPIWASSFNPEFKCLDIGAGGSNPPTFPTQTLGSTGLTATCWAKVTSTASFGALFGDTSGAQVLGISSGGASLGIKFATVGQNAILPTTLALNTWYFFAFVNDGQALGIANAFWDFTKISILSESGTAGWSRLGWTPSTPLAGQIFDCRLYNRALTDEEVYAVRQQGVMGHPNTLNWYRPLVYGKQVATTSIFLPAFGYRWGV